MNKTFDKTDLFENSSNQIILENLNDIRCLLNSTETQEEMKKSTTTLINSNDKLKTQSKLSNQSSQNFATSTATNSPVVKRVAQKTTTTTVSTTSTAILKKPDTKSNPNYIRSNIINTVDNTSLLSRTDIAKKSADLSSQSINLNNTQNSTASLAPPKHFIKKSNTPNMQKVLAKKLKSLPNNVDKANIGKIWLEIIILFFFIMCLKKKCL